MRTRATSHAGQKRDAEAHLFLGPHDPPGLGGVALVLFIFPRLKREGRLKIDNHSGMREIEESGFAAFLV